MPDLRPVSTRRRVQENKKAERRRGGPLRPLLNLQPYRAGTTTVLGGGFGLLLVKVTQPARASALKRAKKHRRMWHSSDPVVRG